VNRSCSIDDISGFLIGVLECHARWYLQAKLETQVCFRPLADEAATVAGNGGCASLLRAAQVYPQRVTRKMARVGGAYTTLETFARHVVLTRIVNGQQGSDEERGGKEGGAGAMGPNQTNPWYELCPCITRVQQQVWIVEEEKLLFSW